MIFIVVKHPVRPEYASDWPALVEEFTVATRAEPGNIFFDWHRSVDDPNLYVLVEAFQDGAAGQAHVNSDHFKAAIAWLPDLLADIPEIVNVVVPEDGWSRMAEMQLRDRDCGNPSRQSARGRRQKPALALALTPGLLCAGGTISGSVHIQPVRRGVGA